MSFNSDNFDALDYKASVLADMFNGFECFESGELQRAVCSYHYIKDDVKENGKTKTRDRLLAMAFLKYGYSVTPLLAMNGTTFEIQKADAQLPYEQRDQQA